MTKVNDFQNNTKSKKINSKMKNIITGSVIIFLYFLITKQLTFLWLSLICTLGISLILYIPIAYILGRLFYFLLGLIFKKFKHKDHKKFNDEQKALLDYINEATRQGLKEKEIRENLKNQGGWKDEEINEVYNTKR